MSETAPSPEERVLLLARTGRDAEVSARVLQEAALGCFITRDLAELTAECERGAGVLLLPEEAMGAPEVAPLLEWLAAQPPWSDLPVIVLSRQGTASPFVSLALSRLPNVMLLELPVRMESLVSAVRAALRARRRQYQLRRQIEEQQRAEAALREADHRKDEFLAMLAHELRNPLAPVRNALHLLRLQAGDRAATDRLREMMDRQIQHMTRLIDDLLDVSRISRGKVSLQRERLDLARLAQMAVEDQQARYEAAGVRLALDLPPGPVWVLGDPTRLTQVVDNLLENARKFTDRGGQVTVSLGVESGGDINTKTRRHEVGNAKVNSLGKNDESFEPSSPSVPLPSPFASSRLRVSSPEAVLTVTDTGIGIAPEVLPHLFEIFMQADNSLERGRGGLGLGLSLVKGLVELHGGRIAAESAGLGQGARFIVQLPVEQEPAAVSSRSGPVRPPKKGLRVLVIEDNPDAAESLMGLLEAHGCVVDVAASGPEGMTAAAAARPDVVLCDIGLPGMDGYAVARALRAERATDHLHLIALTGYGLEEDIRRAREAGFDRHVTKPAEPEQLLRILEEVAAA